MVDRVAAVIGGQLEHPPALGASDFVAIPCGSPEDRTRTFVHQVCRVAPS